MMDLSAYKNNYVLTALVVLTVNSGLNKNSFNSIILTMKQMFFL